MIADVLKEIDPRAEGEIAYALIELLYPLCRDTAVLERAMLWVLNFSGGRHDLLDIAARDCLRAD